jgi:uncharacterized protein YneF (UPF0154 family)
MLHIILLMYLSLVAGVAIGIYLKEKNLIDLDDLK